MGKGKVLPKKYFEDRAERAMIKRMIAEAIPANVCYHNIIAALSEVTSEYVRMWLREIDGELPDSDEVTGNGGANV